MLATLLQDSEVTVVIKYAKPSLIIIYNQVNPMIADRVQAQSGA